MLPGVEVLLLLLYDMTVHSITKLKIPSLLLIFLILLLVRAKPVDLYYTFKTQGFGLRHKKHMHKIKKKTCRAR